MQYSAPTDHSRETYIHFRFAPNVVRKNGGGKEPVAPLACECPDRSPAALDNFCVACVRIICVCGERKRYK